MLTDYFEPFALLERISEPDGLGGQRFSFRYVMDFRGGLSYTAGQEISVGGRAVLRSDPVLLHEFDVTLAPGDYVRRERDGAVYRVTGCTEDMRSPAFSGLQFAQVPLERMVIPC
ncbi:MAG: hypothetical protein IJZ74_10710 [Clostridia bacterium]|nr:hypothetical protein [Clostridia bacterium]